MINHHVYGFFATNEVIRYFTSEPRRLLYVMLFGVAGGIVAYGFYRLSPGSRRKLKLTVLGALGVLLVCALALAAYLMYLLREAAPIVQETGMWGWIVAAFLSVAVTAGLVWLEFRQVWRQT